MNEKKSLLLFGIISVIALASMLFAHQGSSITGKAVLCPEGFFEKAGYCIEEECSDVKCAVYGNYIQRPNCECWTWIGEHVCGIRGSEKTSIKNELCTRRGQQGRLCGSYDSDLKSCVDNPRLSQVFDTI